MPPSYPQQDQSPQEDRSSTAAGVSTDPVPPALQGQVTQQQWDSLSGAEKQKVKAEIERRSLEQVGPLSKAHRQRERARDAARALGGGDEQPEGSGGPTREEMIKIIQSGTKPSDIPQIFEDSFKEAEALSPEINLSEDQKLEGYDIDLSELTDSIDELAKAKVQAAKQGAMTSKKTVENAQMRLVTNAFGPNLFQAITGTKQPGAQVQNYTRALEAAQDDYVEAQGNVETTRATAQAQAAVKNAELETEAQKQEKQSQRQADKFNATNELQLERENRQTQMQLAKSIANLTLEEQARYQQELTKRIESIQERREGEDRSVKGSEIRHNQLILGAKAYARKYRRVKSLKEELAKLPNKMFESFVGGDWEDYARRKVADQKGVDVSQVRTAVENGDQETINMVESAKKKGQQDFQRINEELVKAEAINPRTGLSAMVDDRSELSKQIEEREKELLSVAERKAEKASIGMTSDDSFDDPIVVQSLMQDTIEYNNIVHNENYTGYSDDTQGDDVESTGGSGPTIDGSLNR